ncbi:MAG: hypothetical protein K0Q79_1814 [Flavipsychrobacter sp.]|nr:hypothetical protein [Flavipsychrobacter sp.]
MKHILYIFCALTFIASSCRKQNQAICKSILYAWKETGNGNHLLVEIDAATGKSAESSPYPAVKSIYGCYLAKERSYYTLQISVAGELKLYKFDFVNKTTEVLNYVDSLTLIKNIHEVFLTYNNITGKFYNLREWVIMQKIFAKILWKFSVLVSY